MLKVELGNTNLHVSKLALGTGTNGWGNSSEQTRKGPDWLVEHLKQGYQLGINFWDLADGYGSHAYARRALASLNRDEIVIATKTSSQDELTCRDAVNRFLKELDTDYLDILLLHGKKSDDWNITYRPAMNVLSEFKDKGLVKAVGISCHGLDALKVAAKESWVDVILARVNYADIRMDASTEQVLPVLQTAYNNGKGIYAMKVLGCGPLADNPDKAIRYIMNLDCIHAMTIGHTEDAQLGQNVAIIEHLSGHSSS
ncbi:MAG: aldo/keto reductase [Anaerolineae bacterium]|nr:aldo/keto reductase [Anaerolineae bacterium]